MTDDLLGIALRGFLPGNIILTPPKDGLLDNLESSLGWVLRRKLRFKIEDGMERFFLRELRFNLQVDALVDSGGRWP